MVHKIRKVFLPYMQHLLICQVIALVVKAVC